MSLVNVTHVDVRKNPAALTDGFEFEVVFECLESLEADLEWKLIYVGNAEDKSRDQELDCVVMGPLRRGALKFVFACDGPDFSLIDPDDITGFTIILLTGAYRDEEFIRIGWYVHNVYLTEELQNNPPETPIIENMQRFILTDAPRVTRFGISWDQSKFAEAIQAGQLEGGANNVIDSNDYAQQQQQQENSLLNADKRLHLDENSNKELSRSLLATSCIPPLPGFAVDDRQAQHPMVSHATPILTTNSFFPSESKIMDCDGVNQINSGYYNDQVQGQYPSVGAMNPTQGLYIGRTESNHEMGNQMMHGSAMPVPQVPSTFAEFGGCGSSAYTMPLSVYSSAFGHNVQNRN